MKTRSWIILFSVLFLIACAAAWYLAETGKGRTLAGVYEDGRLVRTIDLSLVSQPVDILLTGVGRCVIRAENGEIFMQASDCPDQLCVAHGPLTGGLPIVCLPNHVVVRWLSTEDLGYDAVSGAISGGMENMP